MASSSLNSQGQHLKLLAPLTIAGAVGATAASVFKLPKGTHSLIVSGKFLYGSGGTTVTFYVQTSLDGGETWTDIMAFQYTTAAATKIQGVTVNTAVVAAATASDGTLTVNTAVSGILGDRVRVKYVTTGTYAGATSLQVDAIAKSNEAV